MYRSEWPEIDTFLAIDGCESTTLSAALALVDDEDFDCFAQTPGEPISPSSSADSTNSACSASEDNEENEDTTRKSIAQPRKRRPTRRNQIQLLHATARQLEARLAILHERAANGQLASVTKARRSSRKMNQMWKHIATNQIKALSESERKNARLRAAVEDQLRLIKGLERFISKRQSKTLSWCPYYFRHSISVNPFDDPQVESEMQGCIEEMLLDVDRILADERLQGHSDEPVSVTEVTSDEQDHQVVESIQARMFPFAHQAVANAQMTMWTSEHVHMMHNVRRKDIHVDGDIVRGVLEGEFQLRDMTAVFRAKMIGRRVIQDGRIIMPAVVVIEPAMKQYKIPLDCTNQVKALNESERENAQLRSMVEDQLRVIKSLERLVTKKRSKTFSWYPEFSKSSSGVDPIEDPEFEKEMSTSIDDMLSDVDRILADERLQGDWDEPVSYVDVSSDDQDHPLIESLHTKIFPATYQAAGNMLWKMWTSTHVHAINNLRRKDVQVDGDSMRGILEGEFKARNLATHFRTKMVGRRVIQDDRIIMPAVVLIEPMIKVDDKPLSGIYLRLRICNIFRNVAGTDEPVTTRVFYALCTPMVFGEDEEHEGRGFGALTKLVLQTSRVRLNMNNQILENQLLKGFAKMNLSDKQ
ncbi:hypothetical protein Poli38472_011840 [Pythium oligandrum]|uniref:Uncharacterized protein n=1 Tax=Pythium oligandrum TaxID=41045 RepID=A0A8K1C7Z5_PYTOL|nr:hypothetical protein Poli38472_011840 [Pythium oligandrum]|eukprot:TMW58252.1 hypothetical protein Poli38472_011840 [Pythium oligandrum]